MLVVIVFGFLYGVRRAGQDTTAAVKRAWRAGTSGGGGRPVKGGKAGKGGRGHVATGHGPGAGTGRRVAMGTAAVITSAGIIRREAAAGWRRGWPEGKERARARFSRDTPVPEDTSRPAPAGTGVDPVEHIELEAPGDRWKRTTPPPLSVVPDHTPNGTTDTNPKETPVMPILSNNRHEVHDLDTYEKMLEQDIKRSGDEVDDAQGGLKRAEEDVQRIDATEAVLRELDFDPDTLAELGAVAEAVQARLAAHQALLQAAEAERSANEKALQGVRKRHSAIKEAANQYMADKKAYVGG